jgi:hypothetical protein
MQPDTTKDTFPNLQKLSLNTDYYNNVFKKTERIVSVIFYILAHIEDSPRSQVHINLLTSRSLSLYERVLESLTWSEPGLSERLSDLQVALVGYAGALRIATAAAVLTPDLESVVQDELDTVTRYIRNHFLEAGKVGLSAAPGPARPTRPARPPAPRATTRVVIPAGDISSDAHLVYSQLTDRSARIKTVLEAKPEATIKDIAEIITDVSEKTIQRELNSLIEKGQVVRQGERRWSKYSIVRS